MLCPLLLLLFLSLFHGSVSGSGSGSGSCCATKTVGDFEYSLVPDRRVDKEMEEELNCLTDCVYERKGKQYCFGPGDQQATCGGSGLEEKIRKLEKMMESMKETQEKESSELKSKLQKEPYMHTCGFATQASESGTLKYNTSQSENFHDLSSLSITDGIFTARTQAFYTVSFSSSVALVDGSPVVLELLKNGESVEGGHTRSQTPAGSGAGKGAGGITHQHVSRTLVVFMAENDKLRLQAELMSNTETLHLSNVSFCLTLSRPFERPSFSPIVPQTSRCIMAGLPLRGRCINIAPGSQQLYECQKYGYKIECTNQSLCEGNGNSGPAACATYKDVCPQPPEVLCPPPGPVFPYSFAAVFPGPSGSFSYLPPGRREFPTGLSASPNSSIPCTCIAFPPFKGTWYSTNIITN